MQKYPKVKVVSDGTIAGTKVFNDKGELMGGIVRLEVEIDVRHNTPKIRLEMLPVSLNVSGDLVRIHRKLKKHIGQVKENGKPR